MLDFLKSARTSELLDELTAAINTQVNAGVVSEKQLQKLIDLIKDASRLRKALLFL
jgi:hypothetical protein